MDDQDHPARQPVRSWASVIVRAWFDDAMDAMEVRKQLDTRGYATQVLTGADGTALLTVKTPGILRAEVDGLIWLGGGGSTLRAGTRSGTHPQDAIPVGRSRPVTTRAVDARGGTG